MHRAARPGCKTVFSTLVLSTLALAASSVLTGCTGRETGTTDPYTCVPGEVRSCPCAGGMTGQQTCNGDGKSYDACASCAFVTSSSSSSGNASSGASSSSGGGSSSGAASSSSSSSGGSGPLVTLSSVTPEAGQIIGTHATITLVFSGTVPTASVEIAGALAPLSVQTWTTTNAANDTLVLTAATAWPDGVLTLALALRGANGNVEENQALAWAVDGQAPLVDFYTPTDRPLLPTAGITVRFSDAVDASTLVLSGSLVAQANAPVWTTRYASVDELTLSPTGTWAGPSETLVVDVQDQAGNPVSTLNATYVIDGTPPTITLANQTGVGPGAPLTLTFDEPVDMATLVLAGNVGSVALPAAVDLQTVRLVPSPRWPVGGGSLAVTVADVAGNSRSRTFAVTTDETLPSVLSADPANQIITASRQTARIRFSDPLDTGSLVLGGRWLGPGAPPVVWTAADTLEVRAPSNGWFDGDLVEISVADPAGNTVAVALTAQVALARPVVPIMVPVRAYRVADSDGSRATSITAAQVTTWLAEANRVYAVAGVRFTFDEAQDFSTLNNTLINQMAGTGDAQWAQEVAAGNQVAAQEPTKLTIFFRWGPGASPTGGAFSWTDYNFVAATGFNNTGVCSHQNITLLAHEMGHNLGLAHTFSATYATVADAQAAYNGNPWFFDGDGIADTPPDPFVGAVQCDLNTTSLTFSGTPFALPRNNIMSYWDSPQMGMSPTQAMRIRQGALVRTRQDIRQVVAGVAAPVVEGESLLASAVPTGGSVGSQYMRAAFLGNWSGDTQLFFGTGAAGSSVQLTFNAPTAGHYRVLAVFTEAPDFGIYLATINGRISGATINLYGSIVAHAPPVDLGVFALRAGANTLLLTAQARDLRSSGFSAGLDYILLQTAN